MGLCPQVCKDWRQVRGEAGQADGIAVTVGGAERLLFSGYNRRAMRNFRRTLLAVLGAAGIAACSSERSGVGAGGTASGSGGSAGSEASGGSSGSSGSGGVAGSAASGGSSGTTGAAGAAACSASNREACLYRPDMTFTVELSVVTGLTYTDAVGLPREVRIAIYRPIGGPAAAPVILLSHGGSNGQTDPSKSMEDWAPVFASAGYVAVAIAHPARDLGTPAYDAMCQFLKVPAGELCDIKLNWDRPHDVARVLDWLDEKVTSEPFKTAVDLERMAHMGHSAGAGAAIMLGGAPRNFVCAKPFGFSPPPTCSGNDLVSLAEPRFDAILAFSPQGPGSDGFMAESFPQIAVPTLVGTGLDDGDPGEPATRLQVFELAAPGDKHLIYVDDPGAVHTFFGGNLEACSTKSSLERCQAMQEWIFAAALAFVDAHLKDDPEAKAWLASQNVAVASDGAASWQSK
jgi:dienelactone hydrolase